MESSKDISAGIEEAKLKLNSNVHELEDKLRKAVDWRETFRQFPLPVLGVAVGTGFVMAKLAGGHSSGRKASSTAGLTGPRLQVRNPQLSQTLEQFKGALISLAAAKTAEVIGQAFPGFAGHYAALRKNGV